MSKLIHLSDLHSGMNKSTNKSILDLAKSISKENPTKIILTGDLTDHGLIVEYKFYLEAFNEFIKQGKIITTAGNHDCLGDGVDRLMMKERIEVFEDQDLYIININSTGEHNRKSIKAHGIIENKTLIEIDTLISNAPKNKVIALMLHHHLYPLPEEAILEWVSRYLGFVFTLEIKTGNDLIEMAKGRVDCIFTGHRHNPYCLEITKDPCPLYLYNAGSTTIGRKYRLFNYDNGKLVGDPIWIHY